MTQKVIPSYKGDSDAYIVAQLIAKGARTDGWIQESGTALLADDHGAISGAPLNAFSESHSSSSYDVTIDTGEAFVGGAWVAKDTQTTVTLSSNTNNQLIYLGWDSGETDTVIIGPEDDFASNDPKIAIWAFDSDSSGVTNTTDNRQIGQSSTLGSVNISDGSQLGQFLSTAISEDANGTFGNSNNEAYRIPGGSSDLVQTIQDGSGKMTMAFNAYYDGSSWRFITGGEYAYALQFGTGDSVKLMVSDSDNVSEDDAIAWNTLSLDSGGNISANGTEFWDGQYNEVKQTFLEGPASELSTHPIPPKDIETGMNSGLDADMVDGFDASDLQGGQWTAIDTYTDDDPSNTFHYYSGTIDEEYDVYKAHVIWINQVDEAEFLNCRLNNDGTSNYYGLYIEDAAEVYRGTASTAWGNIAKIGPYQVGEGHLSFRGSVPSSATTDTVQYPTISADFGGSPIHPHLVSGEFRKEYSTINLVEIFSNSNATGKVKLLGMTI